MSLQRERNHLITELISEGIADARVLGAIKRVPREAFVPVECRGHAYRNIPLPIGQGQTISQPYVVGLMTQSLELDPDDRVLEVGTGSGYQAAVLAQLAREVITVERIAILAGSARETLASLGYSTVRVLVGDGSEGYPDEAPFDAIVVTAAPPRTPARLLDQLADGGRLIVPVGPLQSQELYLHRRLGDRFTTTRLGPVRFVPLVGAAGWTLDEANRYLEME